MPARDGSLEVVMNRRVGLVVTLVPLAALVPTPGRASLPAAPVQPPAGLATAILHEPPSCLAPERTPLLQAELRPAPAGPIAAVVAFRQEGTLYWYEVAMTASGGLLAARLPRPAGGTARIEYLFVARVRDTAPLRSPAYAVAVEPACPADDQAEAAPSITVAHEPSAVPMPPGFLESGLLSRDVARLTSRAAAEAAESARDGVEPAAPRPRAPGPLPSDEVRILTHEAARAGGKPLAGRLLDSNDHELLVSPGGRQTGVTVPRDTIARLQYRPASSRKGRTGRFLLLGAAAAFGVGFVAIQPGGEVNVLGGVAWGTIVSPVGVLFGAIVASLVPAPDDWREVSPGAAARDGSRAGLALRLAWSF